MKIEKGMIAGLVEWDCPNALKAGNQKERGMKVCVRIVCAGETGANVLHTCVRFSNTVCQAT